MKVARNIYRPEARANKGMLFILHDNWSLMASMMVGIQKSVRSQSYSERSELTARDFQHRYMFDLKPTTLNVREKECEAPCTFYDYAPSVFNNIRRLFGVTNSEVAGFD